MKKLNKKPLIIIGAIFGMIILIIIIIACVRSCSGPGSNYEKVEQNMIRAASKYFSTDGNELPKESSSKEVSAAELASSGNMKPLSELLVDKTCTGSVAVYNNGGQYLYIPHLECSEYTTEHLVDKVISSNLVETNNEPVDTSDNSNEESISEENQSNEQNNTASSEQSKDYISGLYKDGNLYVFKGKNPNNYISFGGIMWRIIDIDDNGTMRAIKSEAETRAAYWDTKFNADAGKAYGVNDYKNSYILELMNSNYDSFKDTSKLHLAPYSVCIGKRDGNQLSLDRSIDCSETLENQYIGLVSSSDIARASLDEHCDKITSGACTNYNYLALVTSETWTSTGLTRNTYEVIYVNGGIAAAMNARRTANYNWVIAFNGNEKYIKGSGTSTDPYIIAVESEN